MSLKLFLLFSPALWKVGFCKNLLVDVPTATCMFWQSGKTILIACIKAILGWSQWFQENTLCPKMLPKLTRPWCRTLLSLWPWSRCWQWMTLLYKSSQQFGAMAFPTCWSCMCSQREHAVKSSGIIQYFLGCNEELCKFSSTVLPELMRNIASFELVHNWCRVFCRCQLSQSVVENERIGKRMVKGRRGGVPCWR